MRCSENTEAAFGDDSTASSPALTYPNIQIFTPDQVVYSQRTFLNAGVRYPIRTTGTKIYHEDTPCTRAGHSLYSRCALIIIGRRLIIIGRRLMTAGCRRRHEEKHAQFYLIAHGKTFFVSWRLCGEYFLAPQESFH
jgi:hypothetical protein